MGTVSGSLRLIFFGFDGAASVTGTDVATAGCGETNVGAGKELALRAGWLRLQFEQPTAVAPFVRTGFSVF
jgi:hypothetical protein